MWGSAGFLFSFLFFSWVVTAFVDVDRPPPPGVWPFGSGPVIAFYFLLQKYKDKTMRSRNKDGL